jgi:hypothetical protein
VSRAPQNEGRSCGAAPPAQFSNEVATGVEIMSKSMDRKKDAKKKPAKSLQEKRAAKKEKKQNRGFPF